MLNAGTTKDEKYKVRETTGHVQSERLVLAQLPIEAPIGKGTAEELQLTLERMVLNLRPGQPLALTGERADLPGVKASEIVTSKEIQHSGGFTTLFFESPGLTLRYVRDTVVLNANVAPATHGETVAEVLGSGDGAPPNQRFALRSRRSPTSRRRTPTGRANSLEVRVNGVSVDEVPRALRSERRRASATSSASTTTARRAVIFGDGDAGARLPTRRRERHRHLPQRHRHAPAWSAPDRSR